MKLMPHLRKSAYRRSAPLTGLLLLTLAGGVPAAMATTGGQRQVGHHHRTHKQPPRNRAAEMLGVYDLSGGALGEVTLKPHGQMSWSITGYALACDNGQAQSQASTFPIDTGKGSYHGADFGGKGTPRPGATGPQPQTSMTGHIVTAHRITGTYTVVYVPNPPFSTLSATCTGSFSGTLGRGPGVSPSAGR